MLNTPNGTVPIERFQPDDEIMDRFDSYAEANALVKELAPKGVEATVYKKK